MYVPATVGVTLAGDPVTDTLIPLVEALVDVQVHVYVYVLVYIGVLR